MDNYRLGIDNQRSEHYPRFSPDEYNRRQTEVREMMRKEDVNALLIHGNSTNLHYLTNYHRSSSYLLFFADPAEPMTLFLKLSNHVQNAREISVVDDLRLLLPDPAAKIADRIRGSVPTDGTIGIVGHSPRYEYSIPYDHYRALNNELSNEFIGITGSYTNLMAIKSDEEIERIKRAASLTDAGLSSIIERADEGVREEELAAAFKRAYERKGGESAVSFLSSAPMTDPDPGEGVVWKVPSKRPLKKGDVINLEFGAGYWGYSTQIHRSIAIGSEPSDKYRDLFDIAKEAYDGILNAVTPGNTARDVYEALSPIEQSPFKLYDVAIHGGGNGYFPPFVGTEGSNYWPGDEDPITANWEFEENMVIVIQPNVVTEDERYGLQLGTTVVVRDDGVEDLHNSPAIFEHVSV